MQPAFAPPSRAPELTLRAIATGMVLGSVLSLCNIYAGLKVGWGFNMSITAALLGYGFWEAVRSVIGGRHFGLLENNINQTTASSAASISSAGLVSAVPAWTMITGETLGWVALSLWIFAVSLVGVVVAVSLRRQLILVDKLPFPGGIASAETIREMYAEGSEAFARVAMLMGGALAAAGLKVYTKFAQVSYMAPKVAMPATGKLAEGGVATVSLKNLTFALDPAVLMVGVGALIGFRACVSLLGGAIVAYGFVAPEVLSRGWAAAGAPGEDAIWFGALTKWLLWPGVAMMVTASLTSFAFSWRSIAASLRPGRSAIAADAPSDDADGDFPRSWFLIALAVAAALATWCQVALFDITPWTAALAVVLTFLLAVVAGRVSGETGITPVGPMGKITQLMFGVIEPGNATANLMSANVTGGAASQCGDLLHDLKTGALIGATPRLQSLGQLFGVLAGSLVGAYAYMVLVPDPANMLLTTEWPAPAVAAWKAVAEVFQLGFEAMPQGATTAMAWAGGLGVALAVAEKLASASARTYVPSAASIGLAFVIPAFNSISMFIGGVAALVLGRVAPRWSERFIIVLAAGLIAGESLTGVSFAIYEVIVGLKG